MRHILTALSLALLASHAIAAPFQNGSFESGTLVNTGSFDTLSAGSTAITGWTVTGDGVDYMDTYWVAANGTRSIDMLSCGTAGGVQQTFDTLPGAIYQVTFSLAGNPDGGIKTLTASAAASTANFTFDTAGATASAMNYATKSFTFTATSASTTLAFTGGVLGGGTSCAGSVLDNVAVNVLVAPSTPIPVGGALGGFVLLAAFGAYALRRGAKLS
jgi:choice-of-anchor C domain-containing protein